MISLPKSIEAWPDGDVKRTLKNELEALPTGSLPLANYTTQGGMVDDENITITVFSIEDRSQYVSVRLGVFFSEVVGGCNCHDDPVEENAYADISARIDKQSAKLSFD